MFVFYLFSWLMFNFNINHNHISLFTIFAPCQGICKIELCTLDTVNFWSLLINTVNSSLSKAQFLLPPWLFTAVAWALTSFTALICFLHLLMLAYVCSQYCIYLEYKMMILENLSTALRRNFKLVLSIFNWDKYLHNANIYTAQMSA